MHPPLLARAALFPPLGVPIHVNRPRHGGEVPLHMHDFVEVAVVVAGTARHRHAGGVEQIGPGSVLLIQPGAWHAYHRARDLELYNCCIGTDLLAGDLAWAQRDPLLGPLLVPGQGGPACFSSRGDAAIRDRLHAAAEAIRQDQGDPAGGRVRMIAQVLIVLDAVAAAFARLARGLRPGAAAPHPGLAAAIQAVETDLARVWGLGDLARLADLDPSYLVRLFRRRTGLSPLAWIARRRAERAAALLLATDRPVAGILAEVGWTDANHGARRFRALVGLTPSAYRAHPHRPDAGPAADWIQW
jgi:AraC family L-rhamnose operon transcriptional activator RhaR